MAHKAERGVFELKQGRALCVTDRARSAYALVAAVERLDLDRLGLLGSLGTPLRLLVTHHLGRAMGIDTYEGETALSIGLGADETPPTILGLATERKEARSGSALGFDARPATRTESAGLALARFGRLLPALVSVELDPSSPTLREWIEDGTILQVSTEEAEHQLARSGIEITSVGEAPVPLAGAEDSRFV